MDRLAKCPVEQYFQIVVKKGILAQRLTPPFLSMHTYDHFVRNGKEYGNIMETLAQRLHDHSITDALHDFLAQYPEKKVVAVMGGHNLGRNSDNYVKVCRLSKHLTEQGYLMVSGGGPGAMEATHVGVWFAGEPIEVMIEAIQYLSRAPRYDDPNWLATAFFVSYPKKR